MIKVKCLISLIKVVGTVDAMIVFISTIKSRQTGAINMQNILTDGVNIPALRDGLDLIKARRMVHERYNIADLSDFAACALYIFHVAKASYRVHAYNRLFNDYVSPDNKIYWQAACAVLLARKLIKKNKAGALSLS
jgi:hypothetical protein